ncbi:MAG: methylenetetrahydrofolate reductase [NAD(P)H] [Candidatus Fimenecus sp.]
MRITEKLTVKDSLISFEVFPPKTDSAFDSIERSVRELAAFNPDFMSVTYGAGGGTSQYTVKIASLIKNRLDTTALAHLTCASTTKEQISGILDSLKSNNIDNVLALRGDLPENFSSRSGNYYDYACELVSEIKKYGCFDVGAACYPECHTECDSLEKDIENLKKKVDCGVDFLITQLFYDNDVFYSFIEKIRKKGVFVPVFAGIMPITNIKQIDRIISLSGTKIPDEVNAFLNKYSDNPESLHKAGLDFAVKQVNDLLKNGVQGIHIYTMNKPLTAETVLKGMPR